MNLSSPEELERFSLGNLLGEGADLQVFEGTDSETGEPVVVKRAHPTLVSRNIHHNVEERTLLQAELRDRIEDVSNLLHLHLLTERDNFDWYFGDDPGHKYSVQVEDRAKGIPLVGGVSDMVRGHPIALPLNLFALHPSKAFMSSGYEHPSFAVLAIIERVYDEGYLAQDLGPQNVFYSPASRTIRVIDLGTLTLPRDSTHRHPLFDLNDLLFDLFLQYTTTEPSPSEPGGFTRTREIRLSGTLERKLEVIAKEYANANVSGSDRALKLLTKIGRREYAAVAEFRNDFQDYLASAMTLGMDEATEHAWHQALQGLKSSYWKKYLFDADSELRGLV